MTTCHWSSVRKLRLAIVAAVSAHDVALFAHLLGVLLLVSGIVVAGVGQRLARRSGTVAEIATLLRVARVGVLLAAPGALVVILAGAWLVDLDGLGWHTSWLMAALALLAISFVLGALGGRRPRHARELAERLRDAGEAVTPELVRMLADRWSALANALSGLTMLGVLWLMVAKP